MLTTEKSFPLSDRAPAAMTPAGPPDEELVLSAKTGSRPAFEALVRRYQEPVYFLCYRYVRDHDTAAELSQRAFVRAMDSIRDLRQAEIFRSWLFKIAVNLALNHLRDAAKFVEHTTQEGSVMPEAQTLIEAAETSRGLVAAVSRLPNKQRMIVELRVYQELSFRDIAQALDTTANAAKVGFHHAIKNLRRILVVPADAASAGQDS
jgi:RNA polymerase sigma-70 factor (ECF subfamily)